MIRLYPRNPAPENTKETISIKAHDTVPVVLNSCVELTALALSQ